MTTVRREEDIDLVIEEYTRDRVHNLRAKDEIYGRGQRDCHAILVQDRCVALSIINKYVRSSQS